MSMGFAAGRITTSETSLCSAPRKAFGYRDDAALRRPYLPPHYRAKRHRSGFGSAQDWIEQRRLRNLDMEDRRERLAAFQLGRLAAGIGVPSHKAPDPAG